MTTLADRLYDFTVTKAEDQLIDRIWNETGDDNFTSWFYDYYDLSIELVACKPEYTLPQELLDWLWREGFHTIWLLHTDGYETRYSVNETPVRNRLTEYQSEMVKRHAVYGDIIGKLTRENRRMREYIETLQKKESPPEERPSPSWYEYM
jgi:hypothetical protein